MKGNYLEGFIERNTTQKNSKEDFVVATARRERESGRDESFWVKFDKNLDAVLDEKYGRWTNLHDYF